jgi:hypothetical protein
MVSAATLTDAGPHALTGLRRTQLDALTRLLTPPPRRRRGRPHALSPPDRILLAAMAWRTNLTHRALAALFRVGVATVHRAISQLTPRVAGLLTPRTDRRDLWVIDGTLIPVHDHTITAKSKNYRRSVCVQVVIRARDRRVWSPSARHGPATATTSLSIGPPQPPPRRPIPASSATVPTAPPQTSPHRRHAATTTAPTAHSGTSTVAVPGQNTPSPVSRTGRSSASTVDAETPSTRPSPP